MILINPCTGKEVDASVEAVDLLLAGGFTKKEQELKKAPARKTSTRK